MKKLSVFLTGLLFVCVQAVQAQTVRITGTITSSEDGMPLPGVSVVVKGTTIGGASDANGKYEINVPTDAKILIVSSIGYDAQEIEIAGRAIIDVVLVSESKQIDEVIVVGYGTQRKKDVTSSISKVSAEGISNLATPSFDNQLAGRATGVQVIQPSGLLGAAPTFRVRGVSSITGGTQPLIVVDGVPMTSGDISNGYVAVNAMTDINPEDISSIEILKDGAASAIYGSRAANGVVLISTKKGSKGVTKVNYSGYIGIAKPSKLFDLLNGEQFTMIANEKDATWGVDPSAVYDGTNTNWNDYIYRNALQQSHTLSLSGGTEKSNYYFSVGYTDQEGIIIANDLRRISLKADGASAVNKWLNVGVSVNVSQTKLNGIVEGTNSLSDASFAGIRMLPNVSVMNPDDFTGYNIDAENRKALGRGSNLQTISNNIPLASETFRKK